jgi:hypothetical protein
LAALLAVAVVWALVTSVTPAVAQEDNPPTTRAEAIERQRDEKTARLWPERQSPIAEMANNVVERGLLEGFDSGLGANGLQFVLGGMRSGQGMSWGAGYRRSDIWHDRLGYRVTARGTIETAWMVDAQLFFPRLYTERGFLDIYAKYEYSPQMDYYGQGQYSSLDQRSSYSLSDGHFLARGGWEFFDFLRIGGSVGTIFADSGKGERSGVPSIEEVFDPSDVPGLFINGRFWQAGLFLQVDYTDEPMGPRNGGRYLIEWGHYWDRTEADQFNFRRVDLRLEQYWPYWNKTRVWALRLWGRYTWTDEGQQVPFYLQPTLGGNDDLRGFERYRFYADNSFIGTLEHRWHSFSGMDVALFVDFGKVAEDAALLYRTNLRANFGLGFRFRVRDAVFMRIDQAYGREGYRFMWTFSDIFSSKIR